MQEIYRVKTSPVALSDNMIIGEILEVKNRIEELKEEQKQKLEKKTNLTSNKEKFEKELAEKEAELAELSKKLSAKELEIEGKKQIVQDNIDKKYELAAEINTQDVNYENLEKPGY